MSINQAMFEALQPGVNQLNKSRAEAQQAQDTAEREAALKKYLQQQEPGIAGQKQAAQNAANLDTLKSPEFQSQVNEGGSAKAGDLSVGGNSYAKMAMQGPHQASALQKIAQSTYKGINDQLDSGQATIDNLNLGNSTGDKLALINEGKLSLAGSGGRAIGQMVSLLAGDPTMASDTQKALNWLQNTPNVPTLQPAQRNAIRESVFNRINQVGQLHDQAKQQLMQQGPVLAPQADYGAIINSYVSPAEQKLQGLKKMQGEYNSQRSQMAPQPPISQPSQASQNPTTLDTLQNYFTGKKQSSPAPQPQQSWSPDSFLKGQ